jgi:hypothetical protein
MTTVNIHIVNILDIISYEMVSFFLWTKDTLILSNGNYTDFFVTEPSKKSFYFGSERKRSVLIPEKHGRIPSWL